MLYWDIFWTLSNSRSSGMSGAEPIAVSEIMAYCDGVGIADPEWRSHLLGMVQAMDGAFREEVARMDKERQGK